MTPPPSFQPSRLTESDPAFGRESVLGLSVCGREDGQMDERRRVMVSPGSDPTVSFPMANSVATTTTFLNPDDAAWRQILTATGGFAYTRVQTIGDRSIPLGPGFAHLCRGDAATDGRYPVFITNNTIVNNAPGNPAPLRRLNFAFRFDEIRAIVNSGILPADHYRVAPDNHRYLDLMPDETEVNRIIQLIQGPTSPIAADRRAPMLEAFRQFQRDLQHQSADMQRRGLDSQESMRWEMRIMQGLMMYIMAKQMGLTTSVDNFVSQFVRAAVATPGKIISRDAGGLRRVWGELFTPTSRVSRNMTDQLSKLNSPLTPAAEGLVLEFDRGAFPHVILSGPSGSGKGHAARSAGANIVQGQSEVEAFEGQRVGFRQISASAIVREAGSWLNRAEEIFFRELDNAAKSGRPEIIYLTEADGFAEAGMGPGNQPLNLLKKIYEITEGGDGKYRNLHFLLDSTRWEIIERAAPDLLRRTGFVEIAPPLPQELRSALDVAVDLRRSGSEGPILQRRYNQMTFTPEALDAITALGHFERGAPPSAHLTVMDNIVAELARANRGSTAPVQVTEADVFRTVARRTHTTEQQVAAEYRAISAGGIQNNPRIQSNILEGFYRAYPNPRNGFRNPLNPNPQVLYDAEGRQLPKGSYVNLGEAVNAGRSATMASPVVNAGTQSNTPAPAVTNTGTATNANAAPPVNPMQEVLTRTLNDTAFEAALRNADPALADFYRTNLSNAASPATTVGELALRIGAIDPAIITQANQALLAEGLTLVQTPERFLFEALTRAAAARSGWTPANPTELPARMATFETELRRDSAIERRAGTAVDPRVEQEERERREAEARRTGGGRP